MSHRILVVDDDKEVQDLIVDFLQHGGFSVDRANSTDAALEVFNPAAHSLVVSDLQMPRRDGLDLLRCIRKQTTQVPVIMLTGVGTIQAAVQAIQGGAFDFVTKPVEMQHLLELVNRALELKRLQRENDNLRGEVSALRGSHIAPAGTSLAMKKVLEMARAVAPTDSTVLITGESGTGKEVLADVIQRSSNRASACFIKVNCAALTATLLESELFGHEKGAFTGATERHIGRFEQAQNGTIFLDEIGEMGISTQTRLLRVLQQREMQRVGGSTTIKLNIRVICATNRNLMAEVAANRFREDLFYRINVFPLHLPPLRERRSDIAALAMDLLHSLRKRVGRGPTDISQEALDTLSLYDWPGNVRELENILERCSILCADKILETKDLPSEIMQSPIPSAVGRAGSAVPPGSAPARSEADVAADGTLNAIIADSERKQIVAILEQCHWNVSCTAKKLGISRSTLYVKLDQHRISRNL